MDQRRYNIESSVVDPIILFKIIIRESKKVLEPSVVGLSLLISRRGVVYASLG